MDYDKMAAKLDKLEKLLERRKTGTRSSWKIVEPCKTRDFEDVLADTRAIARFRVVKTDFTDEIVDEMRRQAARLGIESFNFGHPQSGPVSLITKLINPLYSWEYDQDLGRCLTIDFRCADKDVIRMTEEEHRAYRASVEATTAYISFLDKLEKESF